MTIGQIFSYVGGTLFSLAATFLVLHTINTIMPAVDFFIPSSRIGPAGFWFAIPAVLIGFVLFMIGKYGEKLEEWLAERSKRK